MAILTQNRRREGDFPGRAVSIPPGDAIAVPLGPIAKTRRRSWRGRLANVLMELSHNLRYAQEERQAASPQLGDATQP